MASRKRGSSYRILYKGSWRDPGLESPAVIPDRLENGRRARRPWRAGSLHLKERVRHFRRRAKIKAFYKSMRAVQVAHKWKRRAYRAARFSARVGRRVYPAGHRT